MTAFREALLRDRTVALTGAAAPAIETALAGLGARVVTFHPSGDDDAGADALAAQAGPLDVVIHDARGAFADGGAGALRAAVDEAWAAVRALAVGALIPAGRGRIALLAPAADAGPFAEAARDALENLARTLSVEWARYGVSVTAIAPGAGTTDDELAELACFLASPAGGYYSGCRFSLGFIRTS